MTQTPDAHDYDLLAEVATPPGVTAGPWRTDDRGHLVRTLSDGRVQHADGEIVTECRHCTVPTEDTDVCSFCANYTPPATPAQYLDVAINRSDLLRRDLNTVLNELPADAPLFAVADLVEGIGHLRHAIEALHRAADLLAADTEAVR